jgi:hypothetical protein
MPSPEPALGPKGAGLTAIVRAVGRFLTAAGIGFLTFLFVRHDVAGTLAQIPSSVVLQGAGACSAATVVLAAVGLSMLAASAMRTAPHSELAAIYAKSVLAKYVPGNIFQFVSRQVDLAAFGYAQKTVAAASLREIVSLPVAALLVVGAGAFLTGTIDRVLAAFGGAPSANWMNLALFAPLVVAVAIGLWRGWLRWDWLAGHAIYFLVLEAVGMTIFAAIVPASLQPWPLGIFSAAWLCGFVMVGAPGGLGVREVAMVALLRDLAPLPSLVAVSVGLRGVTLIGDVVFAAGAFTVRWISARR